MIHQLLRPARRHEDEAEDRRQPSVHVRLLCLRRPYLVQGLRSARAEVCVKWKRRCRCKRGVQDTMPAAPHASGHLLHDYMILQYQLVIIDMSLVRTVAAHRGLLDMLTCTMVR